MIEDTKETMTKENIEMNIKDDKGSELEVVIINEGVLSSLVTIFINEVDVVEFGSYKTFHSDKNVDQITWFINVKTKTETNMSFDYESNALQVYQTIIGLKSGRLKKPEEEKQVNV